MTASTPYREAAREAERDCVGFTRVRALGVDCAPQDGDVYIGRAESASRVIVRRLERPAAWSVSLWQHDTCLASAEAPELRDAEQACAMRLAFVGDGIRQVLTRFDAEVSR